MTTPNHIIQRAIELKGDSSASEIREVLVREFPNNHIPTPRAINRWLKDSPAILVEQPVHIEQEQKNAPTNYHDNWKEHSEILVSITKSLLKNDLDRVLSPVMFNYVNEAGENESHNYEFIMVKGTTIEDYYIPTKEQILIILEHNIKETIDKYKEWLFNRCFLPHLISELSENSENKDFWAILEEQPYQVIETLRLLAERKTFNGTCPVCKDW